MANKINLDEICAATYKASTVEIEALRKAYYQNKTDNEYLMKEVFKVIEYDDTVAEGLKIMFREAIFGDNKYVRKRVKDRVSKMKSAFK